MNSAFQVLAVGVFLGFSGALQPSSGMSPCCLRTQFGPDCKDHREVVRVHGRSMVHPIVLYRRGPPVGYQHPVKLGIPCKGCRGRVVDTRGPVSDPPLQREASFVCDPSK
eukprot:2203351-Alexandrium_andersonii.AAC.1